MNIKHLSLKNPTTFRSAGALFVPCDTGVLILTSLPEDKHYGILMEIKFYRFMDETKRGGTPGAPFKSQRRKDLSNIWTGF